MKNSICVTCILPTKDRIELLKVAVQSVIKQTLSNFELIIIDDFSKDPVSLESIGISDKRIRVIRTSSPVGGAKARNLGIKEAKGEYVCFLDDDDIIFENKFEICATYLDNNPLLDAVAGSVLIKDIKTGGDYELRLEKGVDNTKMNKVHTNSTLIRRSSLKGILFYEDLAKFQDTQFNTEVFFKFNGYFFDFPVAVWYVNRDSAQISVKSGRFFNTKNYYKLVVYFLFSVKIPLRLMGRHIIRLALFLLRGK